MVVEGVGLVPVGELARVLVSQRRLVTHFHVTVDAKRNRVAVERAGELQCVRLHAIFFAKANLLTLSC